MVANVSQNGIKHASSGNHVEHKKDQDHSRMLLKLYSISVILLDLLTVLLKGVLYILEAIYQTIVPSHKSVAGEIVLITGTGHGIGRELALQFAELGATIVCWDINEEMNKNTVQELAKLGYKAYHYKCDVSKREDVLALAKQVKQEVGDVTVVVNNAGIMPCHPLLAHNEPEIRRIFDINVMAHFWMLEAFLPSMIENNHGHVVALSSMAGLIGTPNLVPYCASKFAVRGLMESLAEEMRKDPRNLDVKFTTICPFIVDTGLCHKPRTRFPNLLGLVHPKKAASDIITAMRRNYSVASLPFGLAELLWFLRLFPMKVQLIIKDFLDSGVDSHDS